MTLDQVYDELYGEIDQIKNELKNTLAQIQYASNFTEGVPLGTLTVGAESSQVIAPHVTLLPGAESGMMVLDLPVGTESAMPVLIQDDPEATELAGDAIPTGKTVESVLNSNFGTMTTKTINISETYGTGTFTYHKIGKICCVSIDITMTADAHAVQVASGGVGSAYDVTTDITAFGSSTIPNAALTFRYNGTVNMFHGKSGAVYKSTLVFITP